MELILKHFPDLTEKQIEQFSKLQELYEEWNAQINVISRKDMENLYLKHVLHSLAITKVVKFADGTNVLDASADFGSVAGSTTQVQYNNAGAFGGDANLTWVAADGLNIGSQKELRLQDTTGGEYIGMKAAGTTTSYTLTMPAAVATSNDQILTSTTGGVLSWVDNSGGTSWQAVITADPSTATAGNGYFCNTTSAAFTVTLPASPSLGDEVTLVDYAGTFDTNNLTVGRNSEKIEGTAADLTVSIERAAFTLVYTDGTQGWLLKDK